MPCIQGKCVYAFDVNSSCWKKNKQQLTLHNVNACGGKKCTQTHLSYKECTVLTHVTYTLHHTFSTTFTLIAYFPSRHCHPLHIEGPAGTSDSTSPASWRGETSTATEEQAEPNTTKGKKRYLTLRPTCHRKLDPP